MALNCVCEHLCFISVCFMCLFSKMYPEVIISAYEKSQRNALLSDCEGNVYSILLTLVLLSLPYSIYMKLQWPHAEAASFSGFLSDSQALLLAVKLII